MNLRAIRKALTPVNEKGQLLIEDVYEREALLEYSREYTLAVVVAVLIVLFLQICFFYYFMKTNSRFDSILAMIGILCCIIMEYFIYLGFMFRFKMKNMPPRVYSNGVEDYYFSIFGTKHEIFVPFIDIIGLYVEVDKKIKNQLAGLMVNQKTMKKPNKEFTKEKIEKMIKFHSEGFREDYLYIATKKGPHLFLIKNLLKNRDEFVKIFKEKGIEITSLQKTALVRNEQKLVDN
jgi:Holliday junction resolvase